jgi:hypothetical protein
MTADEFRQAALALEGASEGAHMGHADFRVNGRIFATLGAPDAAWGPDWGMVILTPDEQAVRIEAAPEVFAPAPGAWGASGSTRVRLAAVDAATLDGALTVAWRLQTAKPPARPRKR